MDNKIVKELKISGILRKLLFVGIPLTLFMVILGVIVNVTAILGVGLVIFLFFVIPMTIVYIEKFKSIYKSIKYLNKYNMKDYVTDISATDYTLPISKICLGNKAFYAAKPSCVIPYEMIVWVYIQQTRYMGVIPMEEKIMIFCRDGELFEIKTNRNELNVLLQYVQMYSPDLMVGYGNNQMRQYNLIIKKFKSLRILKMHYEKIFMKNIKKEKSGVFRNCIW